MGTRNETAVIYQIGNSVLNDQFGNNLLHWQMGTQSKTGLNDQFGNHLLHWQICSRNKTVLIYQFGTNLFRWHIGARDKTVLNDQFGNSVFHSQIGTWTKMFLFHTTRVNILFLPCKKVGPLIVNRNTKTRNDERSFLQYRSSQQTCLKAIKKTAKDLNKKSQMRKLSAKVKWKQALKSGEV